MSKVDRKKGWTPPIRLHSAYLEITVKCNLSCKHCYRNVNQKERPIEEWFAVADKLKSLGIKKVNILGGEPTIVPWFYEFLQYCIDIFPEGVSVETNGTTPTNLEKYKCNIIVSLEYPDKERNDEIRVSPNISSVFETVLSKLAYYKSVNRENVWIRYTIYADSDVEKMIMLAEKYNCNSIGVPLKPVGLGANLKHLMPSGERLAEIYKKVAVLNEKTKNLHIIDTPTYFLFHPMLREQYLPFCGKTALELWKEQRIICPAGLTRIFVSSSLHVHPCPFLQNIDFGHVLKIEEKKLIEKLQEWNRKTIYEPLEGKCATCDYASLCNSECRAIWLNSSDKAKRGLYCPLR